MAKAASCHAVPDSGLQAAWKPGHRTASLFLPEIAH
jgi:hypothetical protein